MKGRKPVPTLLADLHGRPTKTKPNPAEPQPQGDLEAPPDWLSESQKEGWRYAIENAPPGLLKLIDKGALAVWVVAEDLHRQAVKAQSGIGLLVKAPNTGTPLQSPYLAIINRQGLIMLKAASELGFSPVSRPRIGVLSPLGIPTKPAGAANGKAKSGPRRPLGDFLDDHPTVN